MEIPIKRRTLQNLSGCFASNYHSREMGGRPILLNGNSRFQVAISRKINMGQITCWEKERLQKVQCAQQKTCRGKKPTLKPSTLFSSFKHYTVC